MLEVHMTYTYVVLDISPEAYKEIADKLRAANYDHVFTDDGEGREIIDMHGIAVREEP
jgi:hypothetical protein